MVQSMWLEDVGRMETLSHVLRFYKQVDCDRVCGAQGGDVLPVASRGKLYVMGGRSSFTIGNSRFFVDVYSPERHTWCQIKNGCVMVTAHAVLGKKLCCMEWKNKRRLAIFNPTDNSWKMVPVPVAGSTSIGFRFGILDGKLLLFSLQKDPGYHTLLYDPNAAPGSEWQTSEIKTSGSCLCSVTIKA